MENIFVYNAVQSEGELIETKIDLSEIDSVELQSDDERPSAKVSWINGLVEDYYFDAQSGDFERFRDAYYASRQ